ncbi:hypothetical protein ABE137_01920 [Brevibacillus laterosporus]|uniref:hypothetical protein n=1 Tax=Brevibacillus TaxID=55080 RepID=UPI001B231B1F|nr:hypothetical protein [Brevibacillus halotolerans]GIO01911.1 hypothetical protein J5TS2_25790 [Brevibacillus halotolerans]
MRFHLKLPHPALEALNAQEWYALVEMHYPLSSLTKRAFASIFITQRSSDVIWTIRAFDYIR